MGISMPRDRVSMTSAALVVVVHFVVSSIDADGEVEGTILSGLDDHAHRAAEIEVGVIDGSASRMEN